MAVDIFSKAQFEDALPVHNQTGEKLWVPLGLVDGEYTYHVIINEDIKIEVRSSVDSSGWSADTGQDSIRAWLVNGDNQPLGSKVSRWTTRVPGWEIRLLDVLRQLWAMAKAAGYCPKCNVPRGCYRVKKEGPTKGKLFAKCRECGGYFQWLVP